MWWWNGTRLSRALPTGDVGFPCIKHAKNVAVDKRSHVATVVGAYFEVLVLLTKCGALLRCHGSTS